MQVQRFLSGVARVQQPDSFKADNRAVKSQFRFTRKRHWMRIFGCPLRAKADSYTATKWGRYSDLVVGTAEGQRTE
jgi:hypothetical protein